MKKSERCKDSVDGKRTSKVVKKKTAAKGGTKEKAENKIGKTCKSTKDVKSALLKKAMGYDAKEVTEEYAVGENGEVCLSKKKVVKKNVPPDVSAIKILLGCDGDKPVSELSDEELLEERNRLLEELRDK